MEKILIIEDNNSIREEIFIMLCFEGYDVIQADNGLTGLKLVKQEIPDIIISDINMPLLNGFEVLSWVRQNSNTKETPIIFITGNSYNEDIFKTNVFKGTSLISKPFSSEQLLKALNELPVC